MTVIIVPKEECESMSTGGNPPRDHGWWQNRLAERFFRRSRAGQRVRLNIDEDDFPIDGGDCRSLIDAVHAEVAAEECRTVLELLAKQAARFERRVVVKVRQFGDPPPEEPPAVLPGLAVLVLAVHHGGDRFEPNEYYDRLRDLMGYDGDAEIKSGPMRKATRAWEMLEEWSCILKMGRLGMFKARVLGGMRFIGVPLRQALLSPSDEKRLEQAFFDADIDPNSQLSHTASIQLATAAGLRARARKLIEEFPTTLASRDLADDVCEVFDDWQGQSAGPNDQKTGRSRIRITAMVSGVRLESLKALAILPKGAQAVESTSMLDTAGSLPPIEVRPTESVDRRQEIRFEDGSSLAENGDWFDDKKWTIATGRESTTTLYRPSQASVYFESDGGLRLEERFPHELEAGTHYLEVRPRSTTSASLGWITLEAPGGLEFRAHAATISATTQAPPRTVCRVRYGIRTARGGATYFDFAPPVVEWSNPPEGLATARLRTFDSNGRTVAEKEIQAERESVDLGLLSAPNEGVRSTLRVDLEPILSQGRFTAVTAVELGLDGCEDVAPTMIYLERSSAAKTLHPPPSRDGFGELNAAGMLQGRTCTATARVTVEIEDQPTGRVVPSNDVAPIQGSVHERVARLLRSLGSMPWRRGRDLLSQCGKEQTFTDARDVTNQILALHQAGVLELIERDRGGFKSISALAPRVAIAARRVNLGARPGGGFEAGRRFNLSGAWLPEELDDLHRLTRGAAGLIPKLNDDSVRGTLLPGDRCIIAITESAVERLGEICEKIGVQFESDVPDAIGSLAVMDPIEDLLSNLEWRSGRPPTALEEWEFDPDEVRRSREVSAGLSLRSFEFRHSERPIWTHYLHDVEQDRHAIVTDRQSGRWAVRLARHPGTPVPVGSLGELVVPDELRLPRHLERAFAIESGVTPRMGRYSSTVGSGRSPFDDPKIARRFKIPPAVRQRRFLYYPRIHGTPLWPRDSAMPVLGVKAESIATIGLTRSPRRAW